jgi:hypothetical protein
LFGCHFAPAARDSGREYRSSNLSSRDEDEAPSIRADFAETAPGIIAEQTAEQAAHLPKTDISYVAMHAKLIFSPFTITQIGDLKVRALRAGDLIRLGAIRIIPPKPEAS